MTENEVSRTWRKLFSNGDRSDDAFVRAEALLEELRPESPLRHRLEAELDELRKLEEKKRPRVPSGA